jgi:hypothetical protein
LKLGGVVDIGLLIALLGVWLSGCRRVHKGEKIGVVVPALNEGVLIEPTL